LVKNEKMWKQPLQPPQRQGQELINQRVDVKFNLNPMGFILTTRMFDTSRQLRTQTGIRLLINLRVLITPQC